MLLVVALLLGELNTFVVDQSKKLMFELKDKNQDKEKILSN